MVCSVRLANPSPPATAAATDEGDAAAARSAAAAASAVELAARVEKAGLCLENPSVPVA